MVWRKRNLPLHVFHFDCFWMKPSSGAILSGTADFSGPGRDDPPSESERVEKSARSGLTYIGQKSPSLKSYKRKVIYSNARTVRLWQWDKWQPGLAIYDFTNPDACKWYADKLKGLVAMGVDCFKTDFGERIPTDVQWFDGSDPQKMHNHYAYIYNELVWNVLKGHRW